MRTLCSVGKGYTMTKRQPAVLRVGSAHRYDWKRNMTPSEQKEYDEYLQKLREQHPNNTWRLKHNKKYHEACKNGFMQRHCNLDNFVKEEPRVQPSKD